MKPITSSIYSSWKEVQKEKYELIFKKVRFSLIEGKKIVDIGSGPGFLLEFLKSKGVDCCIISIEPDRKMIKKKENTVIGKAENMPFRDGVFDIAFAFDSLHLIGNEDFTRTVKKDGIIIASIFYNDRNFYEREELLTKKMKDCEIIDSFVLNSREKEFVVVARKK